MAVALGLAAGPSSPATATPDDAPTAGIVGDSVPFQALTIWGDTIRRDRNLIWSAVGLGYKIHTVLPEVRAVMRRADPPDIFLVFLGASQSQSQPPSVWRDELRELLDVVSPRVDCIRVFDIDDDRSGYYHLHDRWAPAYNRITRQVTSEYPNAEWYDYALWAGRAGPEYERPDTLHHNGAGQIQVARLMRHAVNTCDPAMQSGPYWDVLDRHPAAEAIAWVGERNLFPGYGNGTYRPEIGGFVFDATRGELLNMAWKLAGRPRGFDPHPWSDGRRALEPALRWAAGARVGSGFPDQTYRPDRVVTRGQALALLWRMAGRPGGLPDDPWADAEGPAIRWAATTRVLAPEGPGTFRPDAPLHRATLARLLHRFDRLAP
jgi:hypothetical protein